MSRCPCPIMSLDSSRHVYRLRRSVRFASFLRSMNGVILWGRMFVRPCVRTYVCLPRNVLLCTTIKPLDLEAPFFALHLCTCWQATFAYVNFHPNRQYPWRSISRSKIRIEYIGKFKRDYLANGDRQHKQRYCQHRNSHVVLGASTYRVQALLARLQSVEWFVPDYSYLNCVNTSTNYRRSSRRSFCNYTIRWQMTTFTHIFHKLLGQLLPFQRSKNCTSLTTKK